MNKKIFLAPNSIKSMAAAHAKIYQDKKEYVLRVSDCHNSIKLWGKTDTEEGINEGIEKLENLINLAAELKQVLEDKRQFMFKETQTPERIKSNVLSKIKRVPEISATIMEKNKVKLKDHLNFFRADNIELLQPYNINLIAELLNIEPHEVWE